MKKTDRVINFVGEEKRIEKIQSTNESRSLPDNSISMRRLDFPMIKGAKLIRH